MAATVDITLALPHSVVQKLEQAAEQEALVARWQEAVIRRSQALMLLQRRGYARPEGAA